jgi:hypothetical protein
LADLFLSTANTPNTPQFPPQPGNPSFFFGNGTNDLILGTNNDFSLVSSLQETIQDVQKILMTDQNSTGIVTLFPLYGTTLQSLIGNKTNPNTLSANVQDQITTALQILFLLTQNRSNPAEIVQTLYSLNTQISGDTNITSLLTVIAANGEEITTSVNISTI